MSRHAISNRADEDFYDVECRLRRNDPDSLDQDATRNSAADPILPPYDVLRAMAGQVMAEFGPDVCGADIVSALTARECQEWLRSLRG